MTITVRFTLCLCFFMSLLSLNAQEFSLQKILEMKQDQKYFESEMIKSDMTLVSINTWTNYCYRLIGEQSCRFVEAKDTGSFDRIPTNDISKKNNNQYYYVEKKINTITKESYREVTFAENYDNVSKKAQSFFEHKTVLTEQQLPGASVPYHSRLSNVSLIITAPPNLYKYYLGQITSIFKYSRTGMYSDMGVFYEYFSETTSQDQEKHRVFIVVNNDDGWSTIKFD